MSQEVPGCTKHSQCITCTRADVCERFAAEKALAGEEIIRNVHAFSVMEIINSYWEEVYKSDRGYYHARLE